jgi:hypothetical protein
MALRKAGIEATVYEAYPTTADGVGGSLAHRPERACRVAGRRRRGRRARHRQADAANAVT